MTMPQAGEQAPDFELVRDGGETVRLADLRGKPIVLYFYPRDDTPGCTVEACNFRDDFAAYRKIGATILGVSSDSVDSHDKFRAKFDLPFPLLADEDHRVAEAYGVWGLKKAYGREYWGVNRITFLIDAEGKIARVYENVRPKVHSEEVLADLKGRAENAS